MKSKELRELKENFRELGLRTSEILDFKILAKGLDKDGYLNEDFELVDLDKFREIQNNLKVEGLLETGFNNFINITNEIDLIPEKLKHNIEKILLGIEQLELFIEKDFLEKQKEIFKKEPKEIQEKDINKEPETKKETSIKESEIPTEENIEEIQTEQEIENDDLYNG